MTSPETSDFSDFTHQTEQARPILSAETLTKDFPLKRGTNRVLNSITLEIREGSFTSLLGPSGCGKSTLLMCLAGLTEPTAGVVRSNGHPVSGPPDDVIYIFQQYSKSVFPWRTVRQNVAFGLQIAGASRRLIEERCTEMLHRVGLEHTADQFPAQLSGGMQQRVAIARALVCRPRVLLMDEPFSAVDALTRAQLQDLVLDIWAEASLTIVFVTHDVEEAVYLSDRVVALSRSPAGIAMDVPIRLDRPREQLRTREMPAYADYRRELLNLVLSQHRE